MGEVLVADTETDGLLDTVSKLHMIQCGTLDGEDVTIYSDTVAPEVEEAARAGVMLGEVPLSLTCPIRPLAEGLDRIRSAETVYFHNGIGYDAHIFDRFAPGTLQRHQVRDTLIRARLLTTERSNSLEAWGQRLRCHKGDFKGPWDRITPEFLAYSQQDIPAGRALARHLIALLPGSERADEIEHAVAYWVDRQHHTGFHLDERGAVELHIELQAQQRDMERSLAAAFPARWRKVGDVVPKTSSSKFHFVKGWPYTRIEWDAFSPSSRQAIATRLQERGWKPRDFTPGGAPVCDEKTLRALAVRFPEVKLLADYFDTSKQSAFVEGWLKKARHGKVHGRVNTLGAYTQRMSHSEPNMAQVPKEGGFRRLWLPRPGWKLVGVDGEGIQARVLAHYTFPWNGGSYGKIIHEGRKEDRTDIHALNVAAISRFFPPAMDFKHRRDTAKNVNYAIFFGGGDPRLAQTLKDGCMAAGFSPPRLPNRELGIAIRRGLETNMKGLSEVTELVQSVFERRGFLFGLDGRKLYPQDKVGRPCKKNSLVTVIQGGEAVIMKLALVIFADEMLPATGWEYDLDWAFVANVHDEVQIEARPEIAQEVGAIFARAITEAGVRLGMKCPLAGEAKVGATWEETH